MCDFTKKINLKLHNNLWIILIITAKIYMLFLCYYLYLYATPCFFFLRPNRALVSDVRNLYFTYFCIH